MRSVDLKKRRRFYCIKLSNNELKMRCKILKCSSTVYSGDYCLRCKHVLIQSIENGLQKLKDEFLADIAKKLVNDYIELVAETNNFSK